MPLYFAFNLIVNRTGLLKIGKLRSKFTVGLHFAHIYGMQITPHFIARLPHMQPNAYQVLMSCPADATLQLVSVFILSRFDYCKSLLAHLHSQAFNSYNVWWMQQHVVMGLSTRDHVKPAFALTYSYIQKCTSSVFSHTTSSQVASCDIWLAVSPTFLLEQIQFHTLTFEGFFFVFDVAHVLF